jgi:signal transduction histidine kinase
MITAMISVFLLPVHLFSYGMIGFQPWSLLYLAHYLVISLIGTIKRRATDAIFFISLVLFIYTLVNDMLLAHSVGAAYNNYMSQVSFQLFVFAMSVLIIMQWGRNYNERIRLESALRFKNKVLTLIAHDLKNPIASIAQFADLLVTKPGLQKKQDIFQSLKDSSQAAVSLLENLLYWSRSQADELAVYPRSFELRKLINEVVDLFIHMASQKELELKVEVAQDIEVYADRLLVHTVVRNLLSNAIKFTPRNGSVSIRAVAKEDQASISVIDTGIGIKPEIIEQFERDGQMQPSTGTEKEHGTGLGLQLVRDLVSKNGGTLDVESQLDKGSVFTFTIPCKEDNLLQT